MLKDIAMATTADPDGDSTCKFLIYHFADHLVISADFHRSMDELLSPHGTVQHAKIVGFHRAFAKCADRDDGYDLLADGHSHLKDILRVSLLVKDNVSLERGRAAAVAKYGDWGCKDRRGEQPRDVLQVIKFQGRCVELQFHFSDVHAAKKLSHAAYGVGRCNPDLGNTTNWDSAGESLFDMNAVRSLPRDPAPEEEGFEFILNRGDLVGISKLGCN